MGNVTDPRQSENYVSVEHRLVRADWPTSYEEKEMAPTQTNLK